MHALPAPAFHLLRRSAGVRVPALVIPVDVAIRPGDPSQLWDRIGHRTEALLTIPQFLLSLLTLGDVLRYAETAEQRAIFVKFNICLFTHPLDLTVRDDAVLDVVWFTRQPRLPFIIDIFPVIWMDHRKKDLIERVLKFNLISQLG